MNMIKYIYFREKFNRIKIVWSEFLGANKSLRITYFLTISAGNLSEVAYVREIL